MDLGRCQNDCQGPGSLAEWSMEPTSCAESCSALGYLTTFECSPLYQIKCYRRIIVLSNDNVTEGTMSPEERMTIDELRKYLHKMRIRYWRAQSRAARSKLLDEMQAVTELHRKSLIRLINGELARTP